MSYIQTILSSIKFYIKKVITENLSDWNATVNDPGFIKNKTHYEEEGFEVILPETTVDVESSYATISNNMPQLIVGNTYIVTFNGTTYTCVARKYNSCVLIGNGEIYGDGQGNGEPFSCDSYEDNHIDLNVENGGNYTISISGYTTIIHKLDEKYLPDGIVAAPIESNNDDGKFLTVVDGAPSWKSLYTYSTEDLIEGESELESGKLYFVYEDEENSGGE